MSQRLAVGILAACVALVSLLFLVSMLQYSGGGLAAPLDDAYIYFQYARRASEGHPFEYSPGDGYSSGATGVAYPFLLAVAHRIGFTGDRLIGFAFFLSAAGLLTTALLAHGTLRPRWGDAAALAAGLLVAVSGWVVWGYLSMMEIWLHGTLLMATVFLLSRASTSGGRAWPMAMGAAAGLAFARPEGMLTGLAAALLGLVMWARGRGRPREGRPAIEDPAWALLPVMAAAAFFLLNWVGSGSLSTNGFEAKSVLSDPHLVTIGKVGQIGQNFVQGGQTLFETFGPRPLGALAFGLAAVGVSVRLPHEWRRNEIGAGTAAAVLLLVGLAAASQGSDLGISARYVLALAPLVPVLTVLGLWELGSLARAQESTKVVAAGIIIVMVLPGVLSWANRFGENSAEHYLQQREVGLWLRDNTPEDALIAINDAGAIAYYSNRRVYDLVGLVTNGQARAFREGQGSVYETIERLSPEERPDYFAVYPSWVHLVVVADEFEQLYAARLDDNRVVGGDTAVV